VPVAGLVRLRRHQFARQVSFGSKLPAVRAYPFSGTPDNNLNWTDPEIDVGSLDTVAAPYRTAPDLTAALTDPSLRYNSIPLLLSGFFGGGVTGTPNGTAFDYAYAPASTTPLDDIDVFTYNFGDDVLDDWFELGDGILESLEVTGPEGLGPITTSMGWRFGSVASTGSTDSPASQLPYLDVLDVDANEVMVYLKDCSIYIASDPYDLDTAQILDALHMFTIRFGGDVDQKRYANGTQSFDVQGYARASRSIEVECTFAKTDDIVGLGSESDSWMSDDAVDRYIRFSFESPTEASAGVPYSWDIRMPIRYYTRAEGESGGNSTVILTGHAFYDAVNFGGVFTSTVTNTLDPSTDL
jgi:hypothetical protein